MFSILIGNLSFIADFVVEKMFSPLKAHIADFPDLGKIDDSSNAKNELFINFFSI